MIPKTERRWVWGFAIAVMVITTIPYAIGFGIQGSQWRFSGFIFGVEDGNSYIAKMLSGSVGEWLFRTPYTAYPQAGVLAYFPYILLGKLASQPGRHEQLVALFQLFRWGAILLYAHAAYEFMAIFIRKLRYRRLGLAVILLGGGLGFLSIFGLKWTGFDGLPLEFYSPETFGFLAVFGLPHIAAGRAFLLWGLAGVLNHNDQSIWRGAVKIGGLWLLLGLMQPLTVVVAWAVLGAGIAASWVIEALRQRSWRGLHCEQLSAQTKLGLLAVLFSAPIPVYTFLSFQLDPFLASWNQQNLILSPPPVDYLLSFGLILPFVIAGTVSGLRQRLPGAPFLIGWLILFPFLGYAPYPLQRRLPEGIWVCMGILALISAELDEKPFVWRRLLPALYIGFFTTLILYAGAIRTVSNVQSPLYVPIQAAKTYQSLEEIASDAFPVVLADYQTSNELPAWAAVRTVIGHGPESKDLSVLRPKVEALLDTSLGEDQADDLLSSQLVSFVLSGPKNPLELDKHYPFLRRFLADGPYTIYINGLK